MGSVSIDEIRDMAFNLQAHIQTLLVTSYEEPIVYLANKPVRVNKISISKMALREVDEILSQLEDLKTELEKCD